MGNYLGSVSLEVDDDAQIISYEEYFPYGGTAFIAGKSQQEVKLKEYRYSGKERDDSTGLYYYGARYYVPWLGRWLKPDPAGTVDGLNLYGFVGGNPITFTDSNGLERKRVDEKLDDFLFGTRDTAGDLEALLSAQEKFTREDHTTEDKFFQEGKLIKTLQKRTYADVGEGKEREVLAFDSNNQPDQNISLNFLSGGTSKVAAEVLQDGQSTGWVLLFANPNNSLVNTEELQKEAKQLTQLRNRGLNVPDIYNPSKPVFTIEVNGNKVGAFLERYMSRDRYLEMNKLTKNTFFETITDGITPEKLEILSGDLDSLETQLTQNPWYDLQLMYDQETGHLIVFDSEPIAPDPGGARARNAQQGLELVQGWNKQVKQLLQNQQGTRK